MPVVHPFQGLLLNLEEKVSRDSRMYLPKEEAYRLLMEWTGHDFGYDVAKWREHIERNGQK
jgi:hypothetical protein